MRALFAPLVTAWAVLAFLLLVENTQSFCVRPSPLFRPRVRPALSGSWQEDLDGILNVDTPCESRQELSKNILKKFNEFTADVVTAVKEKNLDKVAPRDTGYGKTLRNMNSFAQQLAADIIPHALTKSVPKLVEEAPKIASKLLETKPAELLQRGQQAVQSAREMAQDPSALQATVDELKKELRNVIKSTPEGAQTLPFKTLEKWDAVEVRHYAPHAICTAQLNAEGGLLSSVDSPIEALVLSGGYRKLNAYFAGANSKHEASQKLSATVPVITDETTISFVLPDGMLAHEAPLPACAGEVLVKNVPAHVMAVLEFSGLATDAEIRRQRALLENQLISKGVSYDNTTFKVFQYNPLHTLPWVRRNEIAVNISYNH